MILIMPVSVYVRNLISTFLDYSFGSSELRLNIIDAHPKNLFLNE